MSGATPPGEAATTAAGTSAADASTGELISRLSEQSAQLVRYELQLAQAEMTQKAKRLGVGAGLFGTAGLIALYGVGALIATAIAALALVVDVWLAALIVTVVLFAVAGVAALVGKRQVAEGTPVAPEQTIDSVKQDIETVKGAGR
ncbi:phage holin family protein [Nocardioides mangrovicus]|uniref:Phage holin family protein n=1 Tax=Nocardioides mangrovicus TaxID=2478913 RepID=A0A3L8P6T9_9ACTN|nr:phage holin family protein [Nocardioides mangrovicus]RLV50349.1 phage holin family protein [Nocardioides mangrovicus]